MAESLSAEKRTQILRGAASVFAADGYEGASMARIALVAGVSKGTLYNYFDSKATLFTTYVAEQCERSLRHVFDGIDPDGDTATVLRGIGQRMLAMMISDAGLTIFRVVIAEAAKFPELAREFYEAGPARAVGFMVEWLVEQTKRGHLAVADPAFAAEQFFNLCQTQVVMLRRLVMIVDVCPEDIDRVVEGATAVFLSAYQVRFGCGDTPAARTPTWDGKSPRN